MCGCVFVFGCGWVGRGLHRSNLCLSLCWWCQHYLLYVVVNLYQCTLCSVKYYVCNVLFSTLSLSHRVGALLISIVIIIIVIIAVFQVKQPALCSNCHVFCGACIDVWLQRSHQCPTCRVPIDHTNPVKRIRGTLNRCKKIRWLAMLSGGRGKKMKQCSYVLTLNRSNHMQR